MADPNTVVISDTTYRVVEGYFACEDLGLHDLKGVATPVQTYRVTQATGVQGRLDMGMVRGLTLFVGREQAVGLLLERWAQVKEGQGHVILLSGEAGRIGYSVRPGPVGRRGLVDAMLPRNFSHRRAGAKPARPRVSPPEPGASLAPFLETGAAKRRHANVWATGMRPRNLSAFRMPRVLKYLKATMTPCEDVLGQGGSRIRRGGRPWHARKRTVPSPGRPSPLLDTPRCYGEPVIHLRRTTRCGRLCRRPFFLAQNTRPHRGRPQQGEPERWPKEAGSRRAAEER
jgi:hypothetical protein